jgi:uncharacterized protein affecting Mg2+/Co2+ transport
MEIRVQKKLKYIDIEVAILACQLLSLYWSITYMRKAEKRCRGHDRVGRPTAHERANHHHYLQEN